MRDLCADVSNISKGFVGEMNLSRAKFLNNLARFSLGLLFPGLLKAAPKKNISEERIIIVGAGAAGLYAARLLIDNGYIVTVVEAAKTHGGRIRSLLTFSDHPIEMGAEIILGEKSLYYKLLRNQSIKLYNSSLMENFYLCDGKLKDEAEAEADDKFSYVQKVIDGIRDFKGHDCSLESYLKSKDIDEKYFNIPEAILGSDNGSQLGKIGMKSFARSLNEWKSGSENFFLVNRSQISSLEEICKFKDIPIFYDFPVTQIEYGNNEVILFDKKGRKIQGTKAIITVPLNILKKEEIKFTPPLPPEKITAMERLNMDPCIKVALKFQRRFWAESTGYIISSGLAPIFRSSGKTRSSNNNILTARISGEKAAILSNMGKNAIPKILSELDTLFGNNIASNSITDSTYIDWGKEQFIGGGVTYPILNEGNTRENLAKSLKGKLFFAGEATSREHFGTIQGALESSVRVVEEIIS